MYDLFLTEEQREVRNAAREFAQRELLAGVIERALPIGFMGVGDGENE